MEYIESACLCNKGRVRSNNEDNFYFNGKFLPAVNDGLNKPELFRCPLCERPAFYVFDGMGGENFGEDAAFAAAQELSLCKKSFADSLGSHAKYLLRQAARLNMAVVKKERELLTNYMGTTMVCLDFSPRSVYVCNVGDSRAYMLRKGELTQLSKDHVLEFPGKKGKKAPLTQSLGVDPAEMLLEPYIKKIPLAPGDRFLLCSDGLSDMLADEAIAELLSSQSGPAGCAAALVEQALENGGRDNVTVIVSYISEERHG